MVFEAIPKEIFFYSKSLINGQIYWRILPLVNLRRSLLRVFWLSGSS